MKLPNSDFAVIAEQKILNYLLNFGHIDGSHKAEFFSRFGFTILNWKLLEESLKLHCIENEVIETKENEFGVKYLIEGKVKTPDGREPYIRTIWFIENEEEIPQFLIAYPLRS